MWLQAAALLYLGGKLLWSKYTESFAARDPPQKDLSLPRVDEGANIPMLYGKCRVRAPVLAWCHKPHFTSIHDYWHDDDLTGDLDGAYYFGSMFFVLGIPFQDGVQHIHKMWAGEQQVVERTNAATTAMSDLTGDGGFEDNSYPCDLDSFGVPYDEVEDGGFYSPTFGRIEFLNGKSTQMLVDPDNAYEPTTVAGRYMTINTGDGINDLQGNVDPSLVPGYRGFMSVMLYNYSNGHWMVGGSPDVPPYSWEFSSYPNASTRLTAFSSIGDEANPADVLYDLLTADVAKLGTPAERIDLTSFGAAATTLYEESHGYSRSIEDDQTAEEIIEEILFQIQGVIYEDRTTGKLKLKLIRPDYDPATIPHITKHNCEKVEVGSGGWSDLPNKIRIVFSNREKDYQDDSVTAQNMASIVAEGMKVREEVIAMPGVCTVELATTIAERELADLARPLMTVTAWITRTFLRVMPGDAVKLTFSNPDISGLVFRVVEVEHGSLEDGKIRLGLIQDSAYVWRGQTPLSAGLGGMGGGLDAG